jgi:hypothetical protein
MALFLSGMAVVDWLRALSGRNGHISTKNNTAAQKIPRWREKQVQV